jgi:hypothetical protein
MQPNLPWRYLMICLLAVAGIHHEPSHASPTTATPTATSKESIDLKAAVDRFFKDGSLEEAWFAPMKADNFSKFRKQALGGRQQLLKRYGSYQSVRNEGNNYIVTFAKGKMTLVFRLNPQGQIASLGVK